MATSSARWVVMGGRGGRREGATGGGVEVETITSLQEQLAVVGLQQRQESGKYM